MNDNETINRITIKMLPFLTNEQIRKLQHVLKEEILDNSSKNNENDDLVKTFIAAKRVEGCSEKTIVYYEATVRNVIASISKNIDYSWR